MEKEEYASNSLKSKNPQKESAEPRQKVEKVVSGHLSSKKKGGISKFKDIFLADDLHNIGSYLLVDVLVPTIKKAISDIGHNSIDTLIPGGTKYGRNGSSSSKISYRDYYDKPNDRSRTGYDRAQSDTRARSGYDYDDLMVDNRGEVEEVLLQMDEIIDTYGMASVADLYGLVGVSCDHTCNDYGWTDLRTASFRRVADGYTFILPKARPLK